MCPNRQISAFASRYLAKLALMCLVALFLLDCGGKRDEITIGAYLSLSGPDSTFGTDTEDGIALAIAEANAVGGVHGKPVRVVVEDDKSTSQEAALKVRQLIDREHVVAILGEVSSSRSLASQGPWPSVFSVGAIRRRSRAQDDVATPRPPNRPRR